MNENELAEMRKLAEWLGQQAWDIVTAIDERNDRGWTFPVKPSRAIRVITAASEKLEKIAPDLS